MPEGTRIIKCSHLDLAKALVKATDVHEGNWGIVVEFALGATNIKRSEEEGLLPAAIVPVISVGIQRFDTPNPLTVDASQVNPLPTAKPSRRKSASKDRQPKPPES